MIASDALQRAVFAALSGQVTGSVHDEVPPNATSPYTAIGEMTSVPWETLDGDGSEETITIHVWSVARGSLEAKSIMGEIDAALHNQPLEIDGVGLALLRREFAALNKELTSSGETWRHGMLRFRALMYAE